MASPCLDPRSCCGVHRCRDTQAFHFRSPWIPTFGNPNFGGEAVGLPRYRPPQELSLLIRSCGVGLALSATLPSFPAVLSSYEFPRHWSGPAGPWLAPPGIHVHFERPWPLESLHLRSDQLSTSSPTRSSSLCPIETQNLHSRFDNDNACTQHSSAQPHTAASAIRHYSPCSRSMVFWGSVLLRKLRQHRARQSQRQQKPASTPTSPSLSSTSTYRPPF